MEIVILHADKGESDVLPALRDLDHTATYAVYTPSSPELMIEEVCATQPECVLIDATHSLSDARTAVTALSQRAPQIPVIAVFTLATLALLSPGWEITDVVLSDATPVEVHARLLRACAPAEQRTTRSNTLAREHLVIDVSSYSVLLHGEPLDLTFKEFEVLRALAEHPGRVFTREQLLERVWGFDYLGGDRTVDVHIRRLRAKLGSEYGELIGTVRNVGYRFLPRP